MKKTPSNLTISPEFSKRFSQYNEIYTQLKVQNKIQSPQHKIYQQKSIKYMMRGTIQYIDQSIFVKIFRFLNVVELFVILRVCTIWKNIIETEPEIFKVMDLLSLPKKVNSLNIIKLVGRGKDLKKLCLPDNISISDTSYLLMMIAQSLEHLQLNNLNLDFSNLFPKELKTLKVLELTNKNNRIKPFDDNEIKSITFHLPNISELYLNKSPIKDKTLSLLLPSYSNLQTLTLLRCPNLTDDIFPFIVKYCNNLKRLEIGGEDRNYNNKFSMAGFTTLANTRSNLEIIRIEYCARVGNKTIEILAKRFEKHLIQLDIIRNCFEKCSKISDEGLESMKYVPNLEQLSLNYSRKFRENAHVHLGHYLHNLKVLNLRECPLQEDLSILKIGCPLLEEVNLSGNSWVKSTCLMGLSKHDNIRILHLGHFEHSETSCDDNLQEYPPKGMFIEAVFKKKESFPKLHTLYLEQECSLSYWLDVRIKKIRSLLTIKYTQTDNLLTKI